MRVRSLLVAACLGLVPAAALPATAGAALAERDEAWFASDEAPALLANLLGFQTPEGGWCKGYEVRRARDPVAGRAGYGDWRGTPTIDNGATVGEIRVLARGFVRSGRPEYRDACLRGIGFLLGMQLANGGWPQRVAVDGADIGYGKAITFNDGAMIGVMTLLYEVGAGDGFAFADPALRERARAAVARGLDCVLACQVVRDGRPTAWCQQHDPATLAPTGARSYELPSLSASESAGIVLFLMRQERPDERTRRAIDGAAAWFAASELRGRRVERRRDPAAAGGERRALVDDPQARGLWARFYDLDTNRAFFCRRDGAKLWDYGELDDERRNGYAWFGEWGATVAKAHAAWRGDPPRGGGR